jgi:hypothetical protein
VIADEPGVTERVAEATLPMHAPWGLVVSDRVGGAVRAGVDCPLHERVRVIDEDLDPRTRRARRRRADESGVRLLVEEEWRTVDRGPDDRAEAPKLGCAERSLVPAASAASSTASIREMRVVIARVLSSSWVGVPSRSRREGSARDVPASPALASPPI